MRNIRQIQGQFHLNFRDGITREVDNVTSSYINICENWRQDGRSLMYNIKSNGLRMLTLGGTQLGQAGDQSMYRLRTLLDSC